MPVFAAWTDRHFYPGQIDFEVTPGQWMVLFEDDNTYAVTVQNIIICDLLPTATTVYAEREGVEGNEIATVIGHYRDTLEMGYWVEFYDGVRSRQVSYTCHSVS